MKALSASFRTTCQVGLLAGLLIGRANADPSADEKKALRSAQDAFNERAFDVAERRLASFEAKYPASNSRALAQLLRLQALYEKGHSTEALAVATLPSAQIPPELQAPTAFWRGEALLDLTRWADAEAAFRAALAAPVSAELSERARFELAWTRLEQGDDAGALALAQAIANGTDPTVGPAAKLFQARVALSQNRVPAAIDQLKNLLATNPDAATALAAETWLGEAYLAQHQPALAQAALHRVVDNPQAFPRSLVAEAELSLGLADQMLSKGDEAVAAYDQAFRLTENVTTQVNAFHAYLESARTAGNLLDAVARLQEYVRASPQAAPSALLAIGVVLAEAGEDEKAAGYLESLLLDHPGSTCEAQAEAQLGRIYERTGKPAQAIKAWEKCIVESSDPELVRAARFQLGNLDLQTGHASDAVAPLQMLSGGTDGLAESAAYDLVLVEASLNKPDVLTATIEAFRKNFPHSARLPAIALIEGQALARQGKIDAAQASLSAGLTLTGASREDRSALLKTLADFQYQAGNLEEARQTCLKLVRESPNDSLSASQRALFIGLEEKKITTDQVEQSLADLARRYAKQPVGAEALFRLGEFYNYNQVYTKAQETFQQLTLDFPESSLVPQALYFAGCAAAAHQDSTAALELLGRVPENSPFRSDALLARGVIEQQQLRWSDAAATADLVLNREKSGERFIVANLLKGESFFGLGGQNASNYAVALEAFDRILNSPEGTPAERNEAGVRKAKCLEKMGRNAEALAAYLDVLYGHPGGAEAAMASNDFSWQIEAGWQIGRIREGQKDWRGAIETYERLEKLGGAHQREFQDLADRIRRENYIFD